MTSLARFPAPALWSATAFLVVAIVASAAVISGSIPLLSPSSLAPPAAAAAAAAIIAAAAGRDPAGRWPPWTSSAGLVVAAVGLVGGLASGAWFLARPRLSVLDPTGLRLLVDGIHFLSPLVAASIVRRPGSLLATLSVAQLTALAVTPSAAPAAAVLDVPLTVAAAEGWLFWRGPSPFKRSTFGATGLLLGAGSGLAALALHRGAYLGSDLIPTAIARVFAGAAAGYLASRLGSVIPFLRS